MVNELGYLPRNKARQTGVVGRTFILGLSTYVSELYFKHPFIELRYYFELDSSHLLAAYFLAFLKFPPICTVVGLLYIYTLAGPRTVSIASGFVEIKNAQETIEQAAGFLKHQGFTKQDQAKIYDTKFNVLFY